MRLGFYNRGPYALPHPPYPQATLRVIERAIAEAWRIIRDRPQGDFDITTALETRISRDLRVCLLNEVLDSPEVPGFSSELFSITQGGEFESFDGTHLQKEPDLHVYIKRNDPLILRHVDGLFVESKPVDVDHPAGGDYCDKGVIRFVKGEYAWAMPQGLMIGYASQGYTLPTRLRDAVRRRRRALKLTGDVAACPNCEADGYAQLPHITIHRRGFAYPGTRMKAPPITIRHLWLDRN